MTKDRSVDRDATVASEAQINAFAQIAAAYLSNNQVGVDDLGGLLDKIWRHVTGGGPQPQIVQAERTDGAEGAIPHTPYVSPRKSITPDYLICLIDGKKFKTLRRHLKTAYNMTPDDYRRHFNLSDDYPMVAPNYAKKRSDLAKRNGLGQKGED